jgi:hypothetical protein
MKKFKCLLLDANVVIKLFSLGLWDALVKQCEIHLSEIVVREANYYEDSDGERHDINLVPYVERSEITVFSHSVAEFTSFRKSFDPIYVEKLDPGETESLVHLLSPDGEHFHLCSSDAIVFRVLGNLKRSEQGVSLEEVFDQFKFRFTLERQFTRAFRQRWSQEGFADSLYGGGFKE